jgi:hypothetical protein
LKEILSETETDCIEILQEMREHVNNQSFLFRNGKDVDDNTSTNATENRIYVETHLEQID